MPFTGYVDPEVLELTQQQWRLVGEAKALLDNIDNTVVELATFAEQKKNRLLAARERRDRLKLERDQGL